MSTKLSLLFRNKYLFYTLQKIKPKDLAKFIVTHEGELSSFLNKPQVDHDKACARLLLHKALEDKYKLIRSRFSKVAINDLFMSRLERRKLKKEALEKQKNKKKEKNNKVINSEGDWDVENVTVGVISKVKGGEGDELSGDEGSENEMSDENDDNEVSGMESDQSDEEDEIGDGSGPDDVEEQSDAAVESSDEKVKKDVSDILKAIPKEKPVVSDSKSKAEKSEVVNISSIKPEEIQTKKAPKEFIKKNPVKKQKELAKTKHFNEKILQKKLKKDSDAPLVENKIVDPFFITSTGENYMSVVEPKAPDEVKEEHIGGNRRLRRAVQFGLVPKSKLRRNNNNINDDRFNKQNGYGRENNYNNRSSDRQRNDKRSFNDRRFNDFNHKQDFNNRNDMNNVEKQEKLHPSWEAKRKKSGILPYEGKKIVFDES